MDTLDVLVKFLDNEGFLVLLGRAEWGGGVVWAFALLFTLD